MSLLRPVALVVTAAALVLACGAKTPRVAAPMGASSAQAAATAPSDSADPTTEKAVSKDAALDAWVAAPYPARSIARLRTLLHNAPSATRLLDAALLKIQGFDLEQPAYVTSDSKAHVFSLETTVRMPLDAAAIGDVAALMF